MAEKLLTIGEASQRLGLHAQTLRKIVKSGRLKAARIGRAIRIRPEELEEFIQKSQLEQSLFVRPARDAAWKRFHELRERLSRSRDLDPRSGVDILSGMRR